MKCADIDALLCDYADQTLGAEERARVDAHLAGCPACAALLADAQAAVSFMENVPEVEAPAELVTRILYRTEAERERMRGLRPAAARRGIGGWLSSLFQPLLAPRFAMGMAMTILSFSLIGRMAGIPQKPLTAADLAPAQIWSSFDARVHRTYDRVVKYVDNLRLVYEIQHRLSEWSAQEEQDRAEAERRNRQVERTIPAVTPDQQQQQTGERGQKK